MVVPERGVLPPERGVVAPPDDDAAAALRSLLAMAACFAPRLSARNPRRRMRARSTPWICVRVSASQRSPSVVPVPRSAEHEAQCQRHSHRTYSTVD